MSDAQIQFGLAFAYAVFAISAGILAYGYTLQRRWFIGKRGQFLRVMLASILGVFWPVWMLLASIGGPRKR